MNFAHDVPVGVSPNLFDPAYIPRWLSIPNRAMGDRAPASILRTISHPSRPRSTPEATSLSVQCSGSSATMRTTIMLRRDMLKSLASTTCVSSDIHVTGPPHLASLPDKEKPNPEEDEYEYLVLVHHVSPNAPISFSGWISVTNWLNSVEFHGHSDGSIQYKGFSIDHIMDDVEGAKRFISHRFRRRIDRKPIEIAYFSLDGTLVTYSFPRMDFHRHFPNLNPESLLLITPLAAKLSGLHEL